MKNLYRVVMVFILAVPSICLAEGQVLAGVDESFVKENFPLHGLKHVMPEAFNGSSQEGLDEAKIFTLIHVPDGSEVALEAHLGISLWSGGYYGPEHYQEAIEKELEPFASIDKPSDQDKKLIEQVKGRTFLLTDDRPARSYWNPVIGHGIVYIPTVIAPIHSRNQMLVIYSDLDLVKYPGALEVTEALFKAVDARIRGVVQN